MRGPKHAGKRPCSLIGRDTLLCQHPLTPTPVATAPERWRCASKPPSRRSIPRAISVKRCAVCSASPSATCALVAQNDRRVGGKALRQGHPLRVARHEIVRRRREGRLEARQARRAPRHPLMQQGPPTAFPTTNVRRVGGAVCKLPVKRVAITRKSWRGE
jgi:hypothetical protein